MAGLLKDKIVLVTGGSSGIGKAVSILFAKEDAVVFCTSRDWKSRTNDLQDIKSKTEGKSLDFVEVDISIEKSISGLIGLIVDKYGRLDCAVNNAGIAGERGCVHLCSLETWDLVLATNLTGTQLLLKYEIAQMLSQGTKKLTRGCPAGFTKGSIVNISSINGAVIARRNRAAYGASKAGILALTKSAALDYASEKIRVNCISPGAIRTENFEQYTNGDSDKQREYAELTPMQRVGSAEEVAEAALWLCSDCSSYVTGHNLVVDGGYSIY